MHKIVTYRPEGLREAAPQGLLKTTFGTFYYRLSHKLLNFLVNITSEYHKFGLVNYAILCSS